MKLWQQNIELDKQVEAFTIGRDKELDIELASYDVYTNMAHAMMLFKQGFLSQSEYDEIQSGLAIILEKIRHNEFIIEPGIEDIHSQIEFMLTKSIGEAGKKIQCPLLVLWGDANRVLHTYDMLDTWRKVSDNSVEGNVLPCGHYLPEEAPTEVVEAFKSFFKR